MYRPTGGGKYKETPDWTGIITRQNTTVVVLAESSDTSCFCLNGRTNVSNQRSYKQVKVCHKPNFVPSVKINSFACISDSWKQNRNSERQNFWERHLAKKAKVVENNGLSGPKVRCLACNIKAQYWFPPPRYNRPCLKCLGTNIWALHQHCPNTLFFPYFLWFVVFYHASVAVSTFRTSFLFLHSVLFFFTAGVQKILWIWPPTHCSGANFLKRLCFAKAFVNSCKSICECHFCLLSRASADLRAFVTPTGKGLSCDSRVQKARHADLLNIRISKSVSALSSKWSKLLASAIADRRTKCFGPFCNVAWGTRVTTTTKKTQKEKKTSAKKPDFHTEKTKVKNGFLESLSCCCFVLNLSLVLKARLASISWGVCLESARRNVLMGHSQSLQVQTKCNFSFDRSKKHQLILLEQSVLTWRTANLNKFSGFEIQFYQDKCALFRFLREKIFLIGSPQL